MGETITLRGADGFEFSAYHEQAFTPRKGGVIVLQEIFGLDQYVRADVERWAKAGYEVIAPALYDRPGNPYLGPDGWDWPDNWKRFAALSWVAAELGSMR